MLQGGWDDGDVDDECPLTDDLTSSKKKKRGGVPVGVLVDVTCVHRPRSRVLQSFVRAG